MRRLWCWLRGYHRDEWLPLVYGTPPWSSDSGCRDCGQRIWWPT